MHLTRYKLSFLFLLLLLSLGIPLQIFLQASQADTSGSQSSPTPKEPTFNVGCEQPLSDEVFKELRPYEKSILKKIAAEWHLPNDYQGIKPIAKLVILKDGKLKNIELLKSSQNEFIDRQLLNSIQKALPFPASPQGYPFFEREMLVAYSRIEDVRRNPDDKEEKEYLAFIQEAQPWVNNINQKVKQNWQIPLIFKSKKCVVLIGIDAHTGNILSKFIKTTSCKKSFDKSALKAIDQSAPFVMEGLAPHLKKLNRDEDIMSIEIVMHAQLSKR